MFLICTLIIRVYCDYNLVEVLWDDDDFGLTFSSSHCCAPYIPDSFASNCSLKNNNGSSNHDPLLDLCLYAYSMYVSHETYY